MVPSARLIEPPLLTVKPLVIVPVPPMAPPELTTTGLAVRLPLMRSKPAFTVVEPV